MIFAFTEFHRPRATQSDTGITLVELMLSLGITALAFTMMIPTFKLVGALMNRSSREESAFTKTNIIFSHITKAARNSQGTFLISGFRIHPKGKLLTANGNEHSMNFSEKRLRPHQDSTALTFLSTRPDLLLMVRESAASHSSAFLLCVLKSSLDSSERKELKNIRSWLALSIDGVVEARGELLSQKNASLCKGANAFYASFTLPEDPMLFRSALLSDTESSLEASAVLSTAFLLIPLDAYFTLYVDSVGTFRRLSHDSSENQPIAYNIQGLTASNAKTHPGLYKLALKCCSAKNSFEFQRFIFLPTHRWQSVIDLKP